tara:strand:- start:421 stop:2199 length:1779 start_codon:yes stop_codon:yes gene_type:complete
MQPGLRLVFDSAEGDPFGVGALLRTWAGDLLEDDHSRDLLKYEVISKLPDNVVQKTLVQIKTASEDEDTDSPARAIMLFEVAMMLDVDDEGEKSALDFPHWQTLFPQAVISEIVAMGHWDRNGVEARAEPNKVVFDDVDDWWEDTCNEASMIPQVIIGTHLSGDFPSRDPVPLAQILAGLAHVHYAATPATMERMNEVMGDVRAPQGSIRMLLANPSDNPNPEDSALYSPKRIRVIEHEVGMMFEHEIFLRLAERTLVEPLPDWTNETLIKTPTEILDYYLQLEEKEEQKGQKEKEDLKDRIDTLEKDYDNLDDAYHNATVEIQNLKVDINSLKGETKKLREKNTDLDADLHGARTEQKALKKLISGYKVSLTQKKKDLKELNEAKKQQEKEMREIWPILQELINRDELKDMKEVAKTLKDALQPLTQIEQDEVDEEEEIEDGSVHSVLNDIIEEHGDKFAITPSAFRSSKESLFEIPRRVREAFSMMVKSYDYIKNRSKSGQTLDYTKTFRQHADGPNFAVANRESGETMKKFGDNRIFKFEGEKFEMQPHIKIGNSPNPGKTLRIHFIFDKTREKFLIGHCGEHLPTASG